MVTWQRKKQRWSICLASTKSLCIWLSWRLLCSAVLSNGYKHVRTADVDLFFCVPCLFFRATGEASKDIYSTLGVGWLGCSGGWTDGCGGRGWTLGWVDGCGGRALLGRNGSLEPNGEFGA